jgi:hypothetical protein
MIPIKGGYACSRLLWPIAVMGYAAALGLLLVDAQRGG